MPSNSKSKSKSKSNSKKTSGSRTNGTKKTITKSSNTKTKSRTHTHTHTKSKTPSRSRTSPTSNTTRSQKYTSSKPRYNTSGTSRTSRTSRSPHPPFGPSSSLGPGVADPLLYVFLVILALSVIVLLAVGIWLLAARNGWPHGLNHTGNIHYTRFISYGTACIVSAILLILVIVFTLLAALASTGAAARINRLVAVFIASIIFIIFILMIITGIMFAAHKPAFIANIVRDGWTKTLLNDHTVSDTCDIQRKYGCQGWYDNQCRSCRPTRDGVFEYTVPPGSSCSLTQRNFCPRCFNPVGEQTRDIVSAMDVDVDVDATVSASFKNTMQRNFSLSSSVRSEVPGCRYWVRRRNRTFFIPFTVYIVFLTFILLFLSWKTCIDSSGRR